MEEPTGPILAKNQAPTIGKAMDGQVDQEVVEHSLDSALHKTDTGRLLIVDGDLNKRVISKHTARGQGILQGDIQLLHIPLKHIIEGLRAYKDQWLESMVAAKQKYRKNRRPEGGNKE